VSPFGRGDPMETNAGGAGGGGGGESVGGSCVDMNLAFKELAE